LYHPNAYLPNIRDVKPGLKSRSKILRALEETPRSAEEIASKAELSYWNTLYHLRLMEANDIVRRDKSKRPQIWRLTGSGQQSLNDTF